MPPLARGYGRRMAAALLLADAEPETRGFLERHLPGDGFELVSAHARFDLVLAGDVERVDRWLERAPVIVLGREQADSVDRIHAFRRGCDDYVSRPFDYQELVAAISVRAEAPISVSCRDSVAAGLPEHMASYDSKLGKGADTGETGFAPAAVDRRRPSADRGLGP